MGVNIITDNKTDMSETIENSAVIPQLVSKLNDLENIVKDLQGKQLKTDKLLYQSVARIIDLTFNKNVLIEPSNIKELNTLVSQIVDDEAQNSVRTKFMSKIDSIVGQSNVNAVRKELFEFTESIHANTELNSEEVKDLVNFYLKHFGDVEGTIPKIVNLMKPFSQQDHLDMFSGCFESLGYDKFSVENAYLLTREIIGEIKNQDTKLVDEQYKVLSNLWTAKFPEKLFIKEEQRKSISETISQFFSTSLNINLAIKFLTSFQVDIESLPVWQYEMYLTLIPVFVEIRDRIMDSDDINVDNWDVNIYEKFGVTDLNEYTDQKLCIDVNPKVSWNFVKNSAERLFFNLSGTNCLAIAHQKGRRSIQSMTNYVPDLQQDFYYEVKLIHLQQCHKIFGIGCAPKRFNCTADQMVGWYENSIGYHSDDGRIFNNSGSGGDNASTYGNNDVVGCGMSTEYKVIYFTRNGNIEAIVPNFNASNIYHPTMTF